MKGSDKTRWKGKERQRQNEVDGQGKAAKRRWNLLKVGN